MVLVSLSQNAIAVKGFLAQRATMVVELKIRGLLISPSRESQERNRRKVIFYINVRRKLSCATLLRKPENVAFRSMLTPCRVGSAVRSSARGVAGGPRRSTEAVLTEQCSDRFWLLKLCVSRTFLDQLHPQLLRPWIHNSTPCQYFLSSLGAFLGA